jgi:hypothetical protein
MPELFKDILPSILKTKKHQLPTDAEEKDYVPFIVNKALSFHQDCALYANEMNRYHQLDKRLQYDYLFNSIRSSYRPFQKWEKKDKSDDMEMVMMFYSLSETKAKEALKVLSEEQLDTIRKKTRIGGVK